MAVATLKRHWHDEITARGGMGPKRLLDWLLTLRAAEVLRHEKPAAAAVVLGVDLRTLQRTLKRTGGWSPASLGQEAFSSILARFRMALLDPLKE